MTEYKPLRGTLTSKGNYKIDPTAVIDVDNINLGYDASIGPRTEIRGGTINLGNNVSIGPDTRIKGREIHFGDRTLVDEFVRMNISEYFRTGKDSVLRGWSRFEGREIKGKHRFYMNYRSKIGGGDSFDPTAYLHAENWLHLGDGGEINTARGVTIGREVAIGPNSKIYTHGAWGPLWEGFTDKWGPVKIGNFVWIPTNVTISPDVTIGDYCKIARYSLINIDIPAGTHAMGIPVSKHKNEWEINIYPRAISKQEKENIIQEIAKVSEERLYNENKIKHKLSVKNIEEDIYEIEGVTFNMNFPRIISGSVTEETKPLVEKFIDQARRKTFRFDFELDEKGKYVPYPALEN
ncbi:hypothetical protein A3K64_01425 [Candidatus Micrarchaeota archaeon RBG_16_36_9]|nr:MAG: hypothetical protein A3K64_01425 [Candidatus Micrarchaeota archaeon RBG_16_36_9]